MLSIAFLRTAGAAVLGAVAFYLVGLPLPLLLGPIFGCLIAALAGVRLKGAGQVSTLMRTILGVAVGSSITPDLLSRLPEMAYSAAMIPPFILLIGLIGYPFFRILCRFDGPTAFYSAMPGGFQDMAVFGEEAGADIRALSLVHATRVLMIVSLAPAVLIWFYGRSLDAPVGEAIVGFPLGEGLLMAVAAVAGWKLAARLGVFGAAIIGPMVLSAAFSLSGLIENRPPAEAIYAAQFFIGMSIGANYTGITGPELRRFVASGAAYCVILLVISVLFSEGVALLGWAPHMEALLSFSPGGQAEMAVLAIVAGADLAFVVTHHVIRLVTVIVLAPIAARRFDW